jgi:hypothetical protein
VTDFLITLAFGTYLDIVTERIVQLLLGIKEYICTLNMPKFVTSGQMPVLKQQMLCYISFQ